MIGSRMRKIMIGCNVILVLTALLGADIRRNDTTNRQVALPKKKCLGYTIIEFGKGVDCNGDTVKLVKVNGVQVLASSVQ